MAELPESSLSRPRLFAELLDRIGVSQADLDTLAATPIEGEVFMVHADFERKGYASPTDCDGQLRIIDDSETIWTVQCDKCRYEVGVHLAQLDPKRLTSRRLERAGIPEMFRGKVFDSNQPAQQDTLKACRIWIRQFKRDPLPAIALHGRTGRGKSHLLSLIVESLIDKYGVRALYMTAGELFSEMRARMDLGSMDLEWQRIVRTPVLALDDLGSMRSTPWRAELLLALLDYRYSHELPLLVATNLPPVAWEREFGDRAASRMRGITVALELGGEDRRNAAQQSLMGAVA